MSSTIKWNNPHEFSFGGTAKHYCQKGNVIIYLTKIPSDEKNREEVSEYLRQRYQEVSNNGYARLIVPWENGSHNTDFIEEHGHKINLRHIVNGGGRPEEIPLDMTADRPLMPMNRWERIYMNAFNPPKLQGKDIDECILAAEEAMQQYADRLMMGQGRIRRMYEWFLDASHKVRMRPTQTARASRRWTKVKSAEMRSAHAAKLAADLRDTKIRQMQEVEHRNIERDAKSASAKR